MKRKILACLLGFTMLLCSCAFEDKNELPEIIQEKSTVNATDGLLYGFSINCGGNSAAGGSFTVNAKNISEDIIYSGKYSIEIKYKDVWYALKTSVPLSAWITSDSYLKNEMVFNVDWQDIYGSLPNGDYRIIFDMSYKNTDYSIESEFSVTGSKALQ